MCSPSMTYTVNISDKMYTYAPLFSFHYFEAERYMYLLRRVCELVIAWNMLNYLADIWLIPSNYCTNLFGGFWPHVVIGAICYYLFSEILSVILLTCTFKLQCRLWLLFFSILNNLLNVTNTEYLSFWPLCIYDSSPVRFVLAIRTPCGFIKSKHYLVIF